ncbi:hypothetical protein Tco_0248191 [Tanacetum coccineum]
MQTKTELTLEQTQQGVSDEVLVSIEGVEELKRNVKIKGEKKESLLTVRQKPGDRRCGNQCSLFQFFPEDDVNSIDNFEKLYKTYEMSYVRKGVEDRLDDRNKARRFINGLLQNCEHRKEYQTGTEGAYDVAFAIFCNVRTELSQINHTIQEDQRR